MTDADPLDGLHPGIRVVVRHRIEHGLTDALGDLVAADADTVSVRTRRGVEVIVRATVVAAKEVPPRAPRRGSSHLAVSIEDLEALMVDGWPPLQRAQLGGWLLRAADGFTGRANSALPLGSPGMPLSAAVNHVESWYDTRGLRRLFCLFGPEGFRIEEDPLGRELLSRGYIPFNSTAVLTSAIRTLPQEASNPATARPARVRLEPEPSPLWWDAWPYWDAVQDTTDPAGKKGVPPAVVRAVLSGAPDQLFASLEVAGAVVGVARVAFAHAWAGVSALHVAQDHRRLGVAAQLMGALGQASRARGIQSMYLQVELSNSPARSLYEQLGFSTHHEYCYLGA